MLLLPEILAERSSPSGYEFELRVPPQLACFTGHFPGLPVLPGVVQLGWACDLANPRYSLPACFTHIAALKFMQVVKPGELLALALGYDPARREIFFSYRDAKGAECSSGRIGYAGNAQDV